MSDFIMGLLVGLSFAASFRVCFGHQTFTIYDSRRGWVMKWENKT